MRGDENFESMRLSGPEDALHVLNRIVFLKTFADQGPGESFLAQDLVLRISEYNGSVFPTDFHMYVVLGFGVAETGFESSAVSRYNLARNEGEQVGVNDVPVVEHFGDFLTPPRSLLLTTFPSAAILIP